jgi:hypothetical protein
LRSNSKAGFGNPKEVEATIKAVHLFVDAEEFAGACVIVVDGGVSVTLAIAQR